MYKENLTRECYESFKLLKEMINKKDYKVVESQDILQAALKTYDTGLSYALGNCQIYKSQVKEEIEKSILNKERTYEKILIREKNDQSTDNIEKLITQPVEIINEDASEFKIKELENLNISNQVYNAYCASNEYVQQNSDTHKLDTLFFLSAFMRDNSSNCYWIIRKLLYINSDVESDRDIFKYLNFNSYKYQECKDGYKSSMKNGESRKKIGDKINLNDDNISVFEHVCADFSLKAEQGLLNPVIGRDKEIDDIVLSLTRKNKNNVVLLGEGGVGKTAIIEGLALKISKDEIPSLTYRRVYELNLHSLTSLNYFSDKLIINLIEQMKKEKNIILFLDEIHMLGKYRYVIDYLKPAMARGDFRIIGATTQREWNSYIGQDKAFKRRFAEINVEEPDEDDAITIVQKSSVLYENFHKLNFTKDAIKSSVILAKKYLPNHVIPDISFTLIDNASSRKKITSNNIDEKEKIYFTTMKKLKEKLEEEKLIPYNEENINEVRNEISLFQESYYREANDMKKRKYCTKVNWKDIVKEIETINNEKIDLIYAKNLISERSKAKKVNNLKKNMLDKIIGQDEAISVLSDSVIRSFNGFYYKDKPIGSFLFVGQTGVGKTETAKVLARELYDDKSFIRFDMSEYQEKHEVSKLIGSPPGYVGFHNGGQLTNAVKRNPESIILFDEIEKAHPDIFDIFLQILDDARLTDSSGKVVDFSKTIIIFTSNLGARKIKSIKTFGFNTSNKETNFKEIKKTISSEIQKFFRPELLNRLDEIVTFNPFGEEEIYKITKLLINNEKKLLHERGYSLKISNNAINYIAKLSYDPGNGARPIKRTISKILQTNFSKLMMNKNGEKNEFIVDYKGNELIFSLI